MRKLIVVSALVALAACGDLESDPPAEAVIEETIPAVTAADGGPPHGTFTITRPNGEVLTEVLNEDGTFSATNAAGEVTNGSWEQRSPNEYCAKDAEQTEFKCYVEAIDDEGVWISTDPDSGAVSTVARVVESGVAEASDPASGD